MTTTISVCITMLWKNGTRQWEFPWVHNHFFPSDAVVDQHWSSNTDALGILVLWMTKLVVSLAPPFCKVDRVLQLRISLGVVIVGGTSTRTHLWEPQWAQGAPRGPQGALAKISSAYGIPWHTQLESRGWSVGLPGINHPDRKDTLNWGIYEPSRT